MTKRLDKNKLYKFWNFNTLDDNSDTTELMLYSDIADKQEFDWWTGEKSSAVTPKAFREEMNAIESNNICVRINSNGGSVFAASAIATMLREAQENGKTVTCKIDGICASAGSACTTGTLEPSHVLKAMGVPDELIGGALRITLSEENTMEDVKAIVRSVAKNVNELRKMSPTWKGLLKTKCGKQQI